MDSDKSYAIEITLLHEIVTTAEAILPTLPERDRLATNALHTAADEVLPAHDLALEDVPQVSKLLFQIGGRRGPDSLLDKLRAELADIGIELVYTDESLASNDFADSPASEDESSHTNNGATPRAFGDQPDDSTTQDHALLVPQAEKANTESPMHYAPHRRRNSDSIVLGLGANRSEQTSRHRGPASRMARPHSSAAAAPPESQKKEVRFSDVVDSQSASDITWDDPTGPSTFQDIPFRPKTNASGDLPLDPNGSAHPRPPHTEEDGRPSTSAENRPAADFSRFSELAQGARNRLAQLPNGDVLSDEEFSSVSLDELGESDGDIDEDSENDDLTLPKYDQSSAAPDPGGEQPYDFSNCEYSPRRLPYRDAEDEHELDENQNAYLASTEKAFLMSSMNHWRGLARYTRSYNIRAETHAEKWDAWERMGEALETWIEFALTMHVDEEQGKQAFQDHVQRLEQSREAADRTPENVPPTPPVLARGSAHQGVRQSIERSRESVFSVTPRSASDFRSSEGFSRQQSLSIDRTLIDDIPYQTASRRSSFDAPAHRQRSFGRDWRASGAPGREMLSDIAEEPESPEENNIEINAHYQIAAAAWDFFLVSKAFCHWANRADEEVERTEIARRHILRKRCFSAWLGQEENDETEAESKVLWFGQLAAMRQWRDVALETSTKHEAMHRVATRKERRGAVDSSLADWYLEAKMRVAANIDSHRQRRDYLEHWRAESRWLASAHQEANGMFGETLLGRYMRHWRNEARIQERAEEGAGPIIARRDEFLRSGLSLAWRQEAEEARNREKSAVLRELGDLAKHWLYETKLKEWQDEQDYESLDNLSYHWYCEWRLVLAKRVLEQQDKARFLEKWVGATRTSSARSYHLRQLARDVRHHDTITGFFNSSLEALEHLEMQAYHARGLIVQRVVPRVARKWSSQLGHHQRMQNWSQLACLFSMGETVIPHWQRIRKQEWKRRMNRLYRDFRHRVRLGTVAHCLDTWRHGTAIAVTQGWEADDMRVQDDNALVLDAALAWSSRLEVVLFSNEVSKDADKETRFLQWHSLLEVHEENNLDAAEFDLAQTAGAYWDEWTLASVAQRGRELTVQEFTGHNARRDQRHFFALWASQTSGASDRVPDMMDFRVTRRSSRWTTPAPQRTRLTTDYTPFRTPARPNFSSFRQSTTTPAYRPPSDMFFEEEDGVAE